MLTRKRPRRQMPVSPPREKVVSVKAISYSAIALALIWIVVAVWFHAMRVGYWPRFTQIDVLSDLAWLLLSWVFWLLVLLAALAVPALLLSSAMPGSYLRESSEFDSSVRSSPFTFHQVALISSFWFAGSILIEASYATNLSPVQGQAVLAATATFLAMLLWGTFIHKDGSNGWSGISVREYGQLMLGAHLRRLVAELISDGFRMLGLVIGLFLCLKTTAKFLIWYVSIFSDTAPASTISEAGVAFVAPIALILGGWASLMLACRPVVKFGVDRRFPWDMSVLAGGFCLLVLMALSTKGMLELARVSNMRNMTVVVDSKLEPLIGKLTPVQRLGDYATARVDVVFSFGSEIVVSRAGEFLPGTRCDFDWLFVPGRNQKTSEVAVPCLSLPRASVISMM